ncbi:MAG: hypothetical protein D6738_14715 [Acidobacteria bacterium]|nr:MAG: hypothetical protein D6738_14715 [Acidobacteriota bacterium]
MRGLCMECAAEVSQGLACRGRCEADAEELAETIRANVRGRKAALANLRGQRNAVVVATVFMILFGAFLLWVGFQTAEHARWVFLGLGALIGGYGAFLLVRSLRVRVSG